tara:strand:- start:868 stop:1077 length:210 start_codon:yes stop_codon:yes gene_type:complete
MNNQPQEAILVGIRVGNEIKTLEVTDSPSKIEELRQKAAEMQRVGRDLDRKVKKLNVPSGPMLINGQWW